MSNILKTIFIPACAAGGALGGVVGLSGVVTGELSSSTLDLAAGAFFALFAIDSIGLLILHMRSIRSMR